MGSAVNLDEIKRFEVTEVYAHPDAKVDIVFVHGLNGDPRLTWTAKNGVFWPTQLLPITLKSAQARILVYGYNADVYAFGNHQSPSSDMIHQHAQTLLSNLALERKSEEVSDHPIIFVAHSLGGILVKKALEMSEQYRGKNADDLRSIFISTYGLMFLGTPHNGADPAKWGLILQGMVSALVPKKFMDTEAPLVKTLQKNNEILQNINVTFLEIVRRFQVCMVHEAVKTDLHGTRSFIVDKDSAAPLLPDVLYFGIEATHSGMCKFETKNSPGYLAVSTTIKSWVQDCVSVIRARQNFELTTIKMQKDFDAGLLHSERGQSSTTAPNTSIDAPPVNKSTITVIPTLDINPEIENGPTPSAPYFIKPSGLRPNSLFVGRQSQLADMHKKLFDEKRRRDGTCAVLIQCMPGGGKTHLARQYVYTHSNDFPGGIFWVRAKSQTEFAAGYWDIARKATLKHLSKEDIHAAGEDSEQFMKIVKKWLNHRKNWLMVIDGIHFDSMEALQKYIPDCKDACLIYTSTEKAVSGDYHWMNPQIIKLPLLSAREAQELLLLELGKSAPFSTDDLKQSMQLVQSMGFLPVVINSVAQRLKTTDEPLSKFARSFAAEPRLRGLGTYIAVVEDLKILAAYEALHLMYILCFFSQHIPVEMISLGVKALDEHNIPVKTCDRFSGRTLNNTFRVLNLYALIDRNEHDPSPYSSQSFQSSREMLADNIDVIRIHSVVQGFFTDTLYADRNPEVFFLWLNRAVQVFCCSFDMASARIARKTNTGLVEDYRLYEIHGIRLREHCTRHEKKTPMPQTLAMLDSRLARIKDEIDRRTPQSSSFIAGGGGNASQTSIFDRGSSSSDTNPETPGDSDKGGISNSSTWGLDPDQNQHESPVDIPHQLSVNPIFVNPFPSQLDEDAGYESDFENTVLPSPQTLRPSGSPNSTGGLWEEVHHRRKPPRAAHFELGDHRTTRALERNRYRDRKGSYRSLEPVDPRSMRAEVTQQVSPETVHGYVRASSSGPQSRGRLSGQSSAVVALAHISATSPPPLRGRGAIHDRRSASQRSTDRGRMFSGAVSYAAAVSGFARDAMFGESGRRVTDQETSSNIPLTPGQPQSIAVQSLQQPPISVGQLPSTPTSYTPMPPYPPTPGLDYQVQSPGSTSSLFELPDHYNQENLPLVADPSSNIYPRLMGPVPMEKFNASGSRRRHSSSHGYSGDDFRINPGSLESSLHAEQNPLSLSSPNIHLGENNSRQGGYTSQPISRDPSGPYIRSRHSTSSLNAGEWDRRRPSLAETEPPPQLPDFSPHIPPSSDGAYERVQRSREERVTVWNGSRSEVSRVSERLEEWTAITNLEESNQATISRSRSPFNPTAPSFRPSASSLAYTPNLPSAPPNSIFSNPSNGTSPFIHQTLNSSYHSLQSPPGMQYSPQSRTAPPPFLSHSSAPYPQQPQMTPPSFPTAERRGSHEMARSGSGGVRVGKYVIEFGDFPEPVHVREARERAAQARAALNMNNGVGLGISHERR